MLARQTFCLKFVLAKLSILASAPRSYSHLLTAKAQHGPYSVFLKRDIGFKPSANTFGMCEVNPPNPSQVDADPDPTPKLYSDIQDEDWKFSSSEFLSFPLDPKSENYIRRSVPNSVFSVIKPTPLKGQTSLAGLSKAALDLLDLHPSAAANTLFRDFVSGSWIHPSSTPVAHRYGGYQFGYWADQLGDGRAHLLGHYTNRNGSWWELQLKGSGKTPYSRAGDGRAVIRSSVREFLASEFMNALGFRTSRSVSLVVGEELAVRDRFYSGDIEMEKTAVVLRLAPTWFRFGSLEILARKDEIDSLRFLVDNIILRHFKTISITDPKRYLILFSTVVEETAEMIAQWQSIGFAHGVMNTDNMSIVSVTIDYGPFGFLDKYNPSFIPNSSDDGGMYSYKNQPKVGYNNLKRLGEALRPLLSSDDLTQLKVVLAGYDTHFKTAYLKLFTEKLGLENFTYEDDNLIKLLLEMMAAREADFTMTFWELGNINLADLEAKKLPRSFWAVRRLAKDARFPEFLQLYQARIDKEETTEEVRKSIMAKSNPRYVLRNWIAQQVIEKVEEGDFHALEEILLILQNPFTVQSVAEHNGFSGGPPEWAKSLKVSCSS